MFDVSQVRKDFPMLNPKPGKAPLIYLDNAATTLKPQSVIDAVTRYYTEASVNIHRGDYDLSYQVSEAYEEVRRKVAAFIHAKPEEIVFTAGASASLNLVATGYGQKFLKAGDVILATEAEHASGILPWFRVAEKTGAKIEYIPLTQDGQLTVENFRKAMHEGVKLVAVAHVTNVLGYIAPIREITEIAHQLGALVSVDGAQSVPHLATDVQASDVDFLSFSAHKMLGPTGVGVLYGKTALLNQMDPFLLGGGSNARFDICGNITLKSAPFKFEAGTPAIEGVLGLGAAIDYLQHLGMEAIAKREAELKAYLVEHLSPMAHIRLYNPLAPTGIVTFNAKGIFAQDTALYLNSKGIAVRAGNHCAKILVEVLKTNDTVRVSLSFYNTIDEIDALIEALRTISLEKCIDLYL